MNRKLIFFLSVCAIVFTIVLPAAGDDTVALHENSLPGRVFMNEHMILNHEYEPADYTITAGEESTDIDEDELFGGGTTDDDTGDVNEDALFGDDMISDENTDGDTTAEDNEDDMFGGDMVDEYDEKDMDSEMENILLKNETVEWGGKYKFSLAPSWTWQSRDLSPGYIVDNITEADVVGLTTTLQATIFFDARPDENFRVFGKAEINAPFKTDTEWTMEDIFSMKELFADFAIKNRVFFRAGKQTVNWGVGYFFSPADMINLTPIDPEQPELDREGPITLKTQIPIDIHNFYLYLIVADAATPEDVGVAAKFEFVAGTIETGIGGFYQKDLPPAGVLLMSYPVLSYLDLFAEGKIAYGSNEIQGFIDGFVPETREEDLFLSGTVGFMFSLNQINIDWEYITFAAQYYFNGEGYSDLTFLQDHVGIEGLSGVMQSIGFMQLGRHYGAAMVSWNSIADSDFSASIFWIGNLVDGSGQITPSVAWTPFDYVSARLSIPVLYGEDFGEFSLWGRSFGINLDISLGSGSF